MQPDIVTNLKTEHKVLLEILEKVNKLGISSQEGKDVLLSARSILLNHLKKEDSGIYPVLTRAAEKDEQLKDTLKMFARDMDKISQAAIAFFEKYKEGGSGIQFASDYGSLLGTLRMRIRREEDILYKEFEKLAIK